MTKNFLPTTSIEEIKHTIVETIKEAGASPCPPIFVGIGIGGDFAYANYLAKKALLRKIDSVNKNRFYARLEKELLTEINKLNIGIQGLKGKYTCLGVFIETAPRHISSLPVAININCCAYRKKTIVI